MSLALRSYTLRVADERVRVTPATNERGGAFTEAAVDLRGEDAREASRRLGGVVAWLEAREPGVVVRTFAVDLLRSRVLVTLAPGADAARPRLLRFDPPYADELVALARPVEDHIREACARVLAKRRRGS